jgi:hypothetical protein
MNERSEIVSNVVLERAREFLGSSCDAQLRLVSKHFYALMASLPREDLKVTVVYYHIIISSYHTVNTSNTIQPTTYNRTLYIIQPDTLKVAHYLSSGGLFEWARSRLAMPLEDETFHTAATGGHLEALQVAVQQLHDRDWKTKKDWDWLSECSYLAAKCGHIHVLQWLRGLDSGFNWGADVRVTLAAAEGSQLEVLKWSRRQSPPCSFGRHCCDTAGQNNNFPMLKWLLTQDARAPMHSLTLARCTSSNNIEMLQWLLDLERWLAIDFSWQQGFQFDRAPGEWGGGACNSAAREDNFEVLKWLVSRSFLINASTFSAAAGSGNLDMLKWLRARTPPCPWDQHACYSAVWGGHFEVREGRDGCGESRGVQGRCCYTHTHTHSIMHTYTHTHTFAHIQIYKYTHTFKLYRCCSG